MRINIDSLTPIKVARHYDGAADVIEFDVGRWIEAYPALTEYRVEVTSPGGAVYLPESIVLDGNVLKWTIMPSDTGAAGDGEYQIVATGANGERKTSASARFVVREIMEGTAGETPPDPAQPWVDEVVRAARKVEDATVHPPVIGENGNWLLWDFAASAYVDSGVKAQGEDGKDAVSEVTREEFERLNEEIAEQHPTLTAEQIASCKDFASLFKDATGKVDSFLFFTDPHTVHGSDVNGLFENYLNQIAAVYNSVPVSMCVCGGDWLNDTNRKDNACWVLGKIDGAMRKRFGKYVLMVGNHDTNYQGYEYMQSGVDGTYDRDVISECMLSAETIHNLWHREQGESYFKVECDSATYYVFDTGLDWYPDMDEYRWAQVDWFASSLLADKPERSAIMMHIAGSSGATTPFVDAVTQVANAYNSKGNVTLNGVMYDFSNSAGVVGFVIAGHAHSDQAYNVNGIPVVLTINVQASSEYPSFDLVMVDWEDAKINLVRVGRGENRTINLPNNHIQNLFTYGVKADYIDVSGNSAENNPVFSVNQAERYLRRNDPGSNTGVMYKVDRYANDGSAFTLSARFVNETEGNSASSRFFCKAFDSSGDLYTGTVSGWTYNNFYKAHFIDTDNVTFALPNNVAEIQIGFLFNSIENDADYIRIYDIILTKN